jgi:hypothetical protein
VAKKKLLQIPVDDIQFNWVHKSKKEMKMDTIPEFFRTILSYLMESDISELKNRMEKARIAAMLQEVSKKAEEYAKQKEQLEAKLEKIGA